MLKIFTRMTFPKKTKFYIINSSFLLMDRTLKKRIRNPISSKRSSIFITYNTVSNYGVEPRSWIIFWSSEVISKRICTLYLSFTFHLLNKPNLNLNIKITSNLPPFVNFYLEIHNLIKTFLYLYFNCFYQLIKHNFIFQV